MAIQYVKIKRMVSVGSNPGEKFQARIKRSQMIEEKDLCEEITQATTLARGEVRLVIELLLSGKTPKSIKFLPEVP